MSTYFKEAYTSPEVSSSADLQLESLLLVESVDEDADNTGQGNDGWYDDVGDYWGD